MASKAPVVLIEMQQALVPQQQKRSMAQVNSSGKMNGSLAQLLMLLGAVLCVRLISLWWNNSELFFDEAQYWAWSRELEFGYFSKPPMLAWTIAGFTEICGSSSAFCVRLAAPVFHLGTAIVLYFAGRKLFDQKVGFWCAVVYAHLPAVSFSSTIISTDVVLLFFWALALLAFVHLLDEKPDWKWTVLLGIALGCGLLSKYAMAYFFLCAIVFALSGKSDTRFWRKMPFWIAIAIGFVIFSGNIFWNLSNDLTTVSHTGENIGWQGIRFNVTGTLEFVGAQFGVFGPITFGVFLAALWKWRLFGGNEKQRLLVAFSAPVLFIIITQAMISKAYANWAAVTYVAATVLVVQLMVQRIPSKWLKATNWIHGIVFIVISLVVTRAGPGQLVLPGYIEPFARTQGAGELTELVREAVRNGDFEAVVTADRRTSALLTYGLRNADIPVKAWREGSVPENYFEQRKAFQDAPIQPVLFVIRNTGDAVFNANFKDVKKLKSHKLSSGLLGQVNLYRADGLKEAEQ